VALKKRNPQPSNVHKLEKAAKEECNALPQKVYRNLILSMPNRIQVVMLQMEEIKFILGLIKKLLQYHKYNTFVPLYYSAARPK